MEFAFYGEADNQKKRGKKRGPGRFIRKHRLACALFVCALCALILLLVLYSPFRYNAASDETGLTHPETLALYDKKGLGYSFLYPAGSAIAEEADGSACVYGNAAGSLPYVLVNRLEKGNLRPERYFHNCDDLMLEQFASVESTPIQQVQIDDKTLYLTRYQVKNGAETLIIDRYVELYRRYAIEYTAIAKTAGELDTALYYAIKTLRTNEGAYEGAYSETVERHDLDDIGIAMDLPTMLDRKELTIGLYASGRDAVLLTLLCTKDDTGAPVYNRQDFIDRAALSPAFVSGYIGADEMTFTEGTERRMNGRSFYVYPMELINGGYHYTGELALVNADETGVYVSLWAVRTDCINREALTALLTDCVQSTELG